MPPRLEPMAEPDEPELPDEEPEEPELPEEPEEEPDEEPPEREPPEDEPPPPPRPPPPPPPPPPLPPPPLRLKIAGQVRGRRRVGGCSAGSVRAIRFVSVVERGREAEVASWRVRERVVRERSFMVAGGRMN